MVLFSGLSDYVNYIPHKLTSHRHSVMTCRAPRHSLSDNTALLLAMWPNNK